jgi:hypothetical protein
LPNGRDQRLATIDEPHRRILSRVRCIAWFALAGDGRMMPLFPRPDVTKIDFVRRICGDCKPHGRGGVAFFLVLAARVEHRTSSFTVFN